MNSAVNKSRRAGHEGRIPGKPERWMRSIQFQMSTYLAAILGLCALTTPSIDGGCVVRAEPLQLSQETQAPAASPSSSPQDSPQNTAPAKPPVATGAEPQPEAASPPETQPEANAKPESSAPSRRNPDQERPARNGATGRPRDCASGAAPEKKVVRNGGTADPVVQLAPGISEEQASSQRQNTSQLLAATGRQPETDFRPPAELKPAGQR